MTLKLHKYAAVCQEDDEIFYSGLGDTPDEAYSEFMQNGEFEQYCCYEGFYKQGEDDVSVYIYEICSPEESDYPEDEINPDWSWVLHKKIETRKAKAQ